jgi:DNA-binding NarL/FixJ family response regulator
VLSLDAPAKEGGELHEYVASPAPAVHEYAEAREGWETIRPAVPFNQLQALKMRSHGYTNREIGKVYHLSPGAISTRICRLRKKIAA